MEVAPHRLVEGLQERLQPLEVEFHEAYWQSQVSATPENERRRNALELELRRIKGDRDSYEAVVAALEEPIHEPQLLRLLEVLRASMTANQMDEEQRTRMVELDTAIESAFASHRPVVDGKRVNDNEIEEILRTSSDNELRRQAWEGSKEIGGVVADRVREIARLRNNAAVDLGYADYFQMALALQEIPEDWLFSTLDELEQLTKPIFSRWKEELDVRLRDRFGVSEVRPWHYSDPFFQTLPPDGRITLDPYLVKLDPVDLALRTFSAWDIDLARVMDLSDLYPRDHKCQHAFCIDIDRSSEDVRILANVVPGERWTEVMLHESGHAAYDVSIDGSLPYLLRRAAHTFVTEAIALLSGRLVRDATWLSEIAGAPSDEVEQVGVRLRSATAAQNLLFARWVLVVTNFERQLYADPEGDLNSIWWDLVERYQLVERPPQRDEPDWAAKIHVASAPAYYHNYLLGDLLASQLLATIKREGHELVGNREAGEFLRERVFRHGSSLRWDALVERATGRELSAGDFVGELGAAVSG
jgi:peptidyl-dipeptidase A